MRKYRNTVKSNIDSDCKKIIAIANAWYEFKACYAYEMNYGGGKSGTGAIFLYCDIIFQL